MELNQFMFPVEVRPVTVPDGVTGSVYQIPSNYRAIIRGDTNEVISIVKNSYQIVRNEDLINNLLEELSTLDTPYRIDPSHSFVNNNKMRLQITFPDLTMWDENSEIALSLFLHNSYDMSEGVRFMFGAIRSICTNGMVFGNILSKYYAKHTKGFKIGNLKDSLSTTYDQIPAIQNRIKQLESAPVTTEIMDRVENRVGKKLSKRVIDQNPQSQWEMYNGLTHYISHDIEQRFRARYQTAVSRAFRL